MRRVVLVAALAVGALITAVTVWIAPGIAAGALLHRSRTTPYRDRPPSCRDEMFAGEGVRLAGWRCAPAGPRRGAIVYLHGIGDNRSGAAGVVERFAPLGFEVVAYDSRAHGQSEGNYCTYGVRERHDLRRVIATIDEGTVVLIGGSLGAAVALQTAAIEPRIDAIVAAEVFSDLRTVASERARKLFLPPWTVWRAFPIAEKRGGFRIEDASPIEAARRIGIPVLLLHGANDEDTSPAHSRRVHDALTGRRELLIVPGAGHNGTLPAPGVWEHIQRWISQLA
jgi:pimeloyl-ACP methyl ester carboxylesterase